MLPGIKFLGDTMSSDVSIDGPIVEEVSSFVFRDDSGFLATVQKCSELGRYYFWFLSDWIRDKISTPFVWIGQFLRDRLYFPLTHPDEGFQSNMNLAAHIKGLLTGAEPISPTKAFPKMEEVRQAFHIETIPILIKTEVQTTTFNLYVVESKEQVNGKGVRFFLFSFYDNYVEKDGEKLNWKPATIFELGAAPILILKALKEKGVTIDSLDLFSLGAVAFEGMRYLNGSDIDIIPKTVILDRAMSSTYKVAQNLYSFPMKHLLYGAAYSSNWDGDPEGACLEFFEKVSTSMAGRTVIQVEARNDHYFSGVGAYSSDFLSRLKELGMTTYSGKFYVPCYKESAHHALSRGLIYCNPKNSGTDVEQFLEMEPLEALSDALMRELYLNPNYSSGSYHQSLVVGGNAENLDILLLRVYAMLQSFVES